MNNTPTETTDEPIDRRWLAIFEDRYGAGSYSRLTALLARPCVTFAEIARQFGVSRERVRQWQGSLTPEAPSGHERQRRCALYQQKRRLLQDPLFLAFYRHARPHFDAGQIELIRSGDGYRTRSVRIDTQVVAIRDARPKPRGGAPVYDLPRNRASASFVYLRLNADDFLFLSASDWPTGGTTFTDRPNARYQPFKNTFAALQPTSPRNPATDAHVGYADDVTL